MSFTRNKLFVAVFFISVCLRWTASRHQRDKPDYTDTNKQTVVGSREHLTGSQSNTETSNSPVHKSSREQQNIGSVANEESVANLEQEAQKSGHNIESEQDWQEESSPLREDTEDSRDEYVTTELREPIKEDALKQNIASSEYQPDEPHPIDSNEEATTETDGESAGSESDTETLSTPLHDPDLRGNIATMEQEYQESVHDTVQNSQKEASSREDIVDDSITAKEPIEEDVLSRHEHSPDVISKTKVEEKETFRREDSVDSLDDSKEPMGGAALEQESMSVHGPDIISETRVEENTRRNTNIRQPEMNDVGNGNDGIEDNLHAEQVTRKENDGRTNSVSEEDGEHERYLEKEENEDFKERKDEETSEQVEREENEVSSTVSERTFSVSEEEGKNEKQLEKEDFKEEETSEQLEQEESSSRKSKREFDPVGGEDPAFIGGDHQSSEHGGGTEVENLESKEPKEDTFLKGINLVTKVDTSEKAKGYVYVKEAAEAGHTRAKEQLAYAYLFGSVLERNFTKSFEIFTELAAQGNPIGQQGLGFMYSTGIGVNSSQAKALVYYTFAALGGHHYAQMTMGYRSLMGITVSQNCEAALLHYQKAAKKVADEVDIISGGAMISKVRLMEEDNEATNVYGVSEDDMLHYHNVFEDSGNTGAQVLLGVFYMFGVAGAERNFQMALRFLHSAANEGFAAANALIGKIYAEGSPEVPRDYNMAMKYFKKAKEMNHADGYSGIGMMYLNGMGVEQDYSTALEYLEKASEKGSTEGQYYLGHMHYEGLGTRRNINKALKFFQLSSRGGHVLALYRLAEMHADGTGVSRNCAYAVELYKGVAERCKWTHIMEDAERSYMAGDLDSALMLYRLLSEMGIEVAQTNAAYILEQEGVTLVQDKETLKRALILWNRSASQGYAMARVKLGDYYYYGQGTEVNYEAAVGQYRIASDKQASAQAMFNLAYMYEQGFGLQKDYHLAKRYYDLAAETSADAHAPVALALLKLSLLHYYDFISDAVSGVVVVEALEGVGSLGGENWDIYLISLLSGLLLLLFIWRWRR